MKDKVSQYHTSLVGDINCKNKILNIIYNI